MIASLLARAFAEDPLMRYVIGDEGARHRHLTMLFAGAERACRIRGGVAEQREARAVLAAAIWLPFAVMPVSLATIVRSGMIWAPLVLGGPAIARLQRHEAPCERYLRRTLPTSSGYLWSVGVEPAATGRGLGRSVIAAACAEMTAHQLTHCALKTENASNVALYRRLGFQMLDTLIDQRSGLTSWAMAKALPQKGEAFGNWGGVICA